MPLDVLPADWRETGGLVEAIRKTAGAAGAQGLVDFLPAERAITEQAIMSLIPAAAQFFAAETASRSVSTTAPSG